ncbi:MAG: acyl-CoA dehydrogenase family protein [Actinomycetota bacterium]|jgi:alkylation response protein AidB-like acyl-CoA dehydrogenase
MDLRLSNDEELLRRGARELLARRAPLDKTAAAEGDPLADDAALWAEMAALGWLGLTIPEDRGGSAGTLLHLELLTEEFGRALGPGPFVPVMVAAGMLEAAAGEVSQRLLRELVEGAARPVPALTGRSGRIAGHPGVTIADGGATGEKGFVDAAATADWLLTTAFPGGGDDLRVIVVDAHDPAVEIVPRPTIAGLSTALVRFDAAAVVADLGGPELVDVAVTRAAVLQAGWCAGAAARLVEDTVAYISERMQFGVPIGSFQSVQHRMADCSIAVAEAATLARQAAAALDGGEASGRRLGSTAFVRSTDAFVAVARHCHQVWGGIGYGTEAHVQLFSRRAKAAQQAWGGTDHHLDVVAAELAGVPLTRDRYPHLGPGRSNSEIPLLTRERR